MNKDEIVIAALKERQKELEQELNSIQDSIKWAEVKAKQLKFKRLTKTGKKRTSLKKGDFPELGI